MAAASGLSPRRAHRPELSTPLVRGGERGAAPSAAVRGAAHIESVLAPDWRFGDKLLAGRGAQCG